MKQEAKLPYLLECLQKTAPPVLIFAENKARACGAIACSPLAVPDSMCCTHLPHQRWRRGSSLLKLLRPASQLTWRMTLLGRRMWTTSTSGC